MFMSLQYTKLQCIYPRKSNSNILYLLIIEPKLLNILKSNLRTKAAKYLISSDHRTKASEYFKI